MIYQLQKLVFDACAGKEAHCTDPCAGKEAYCTDPCARKEAYYIALIHVRENGILMDVLTRKLE